jgi:methylmalonyl-CoA mutase N-terminal domain/subunit
MTDIRAESGFPIERVYGGADTEQPGQFPFTRGIHEEMYRSRLWRMRQYAGYGSIEETKQRWKVLRDSGQNGISCAFDLPTQLGLDSDRPEAIDEVGRLGVAIDSLADMQDLFASIPLDSVAATFNINAPAAIVYAMFLATAQSQGADLTKVTGTLSNDPLVEMVARGLWRLPTQPALRLFADTFLTSLDLTPNFYPVNIRGCLFYEAGASDEQEIAFSLGCGREYMRTLIDRGCSPDHVGDRFSFMMFADHNIFEQAAKFRAARRLWARICADEFGATAPSAMKYRVTAPVGSYNFKAQQPELNIVRAAYGALAAALGGCQAMLVAGYDEAYAIPTERAALLALRTQQVLAEESGVTKTVDPLGGSYFVEALTDEYERGARVWLDRLDEVGGMAAAIELGIPQRAIADHAFEIEKAVTDGTKRVVGVNCFVEDDDPQDRLTLHEFDDAARVSQLRRLIGWRECRDGNAVAAALGEFADALPTDANLTPYLVDAAVAGATMGEMMDVLTAAFGDYRESFSL